MPLNIPDDVLNLIGQYSSISFKTKKYKHHAFKMNIQKIKYKCCMCNHLCNNYEYDHDDYTCKNIDHCGTRCSDSFDAVAEKWNDFKKSLIFSDLYGYDWDKIIKYNALVRDFFMLRFLSNVPVGEEVEMPDINYDSNIICKYVCNLEPSTQRAHMYLFDGSSAIDFHS